MRANRNLLLSALALMAFAVPASAQIIGNGGFELPPPPLPEIGTWQYNNGAVRDGTKPRTGSFAANLDNQIGAGNVNVFQQTLPGTILPGVGYNLSFYSQGTYGVAGEGQLQISFLNAGGGILPGSPIFPQIPASANYTLNTRVLTAPADASAIYVGFNAVTGAVAGASSHLYIDDVNLSLVPEPASLATLAGASLLFRRRRSI